MEAEAQLGWGALSKARLNLAMVVVLEGFLHVLNRYLFVDLDCHCVF